MSIRNEGRVIVTGGTGFLGFRTVAALLEAELEVTVMVRQEQAEKLDPFGNRINVVFGDVWNKGSLKGRARNHGTVIHLLGSTHTNPARGYTHHQINLVSARNVATMAVGDGVPRMILLSSVMRPLAVPGEYIRSKREAEDYLKKSGLEWTIIRAPALYPDGRGQFLLNSLSFLGRVFPLNVLIGRMLPLTVDVAARGIAQLAANPSVYNEQIIYAPALRQLARQAKQHRPLIQPQQNQEDSDDEPPFGWLPGA